MRTVQLPDEHSNESAEARAHARNHHSQLRVSDVRALLLVGIRLQEPPTEGVALGKASE